MNFQSLFSILFVMASIILFASCERVVVNSSDNDELIASVADLEGGSSFKAVVPIIISKCASCHTHQGWYAFNERAYLYAGLVTPGVSVSSKMYYRLSSASSGPGPRNMPQGGGVAFTDEEAALMKTWVENFLN